MDTLTELLEDELKDLFSAENQLLKALPKLAKKASTESLAEAFATHLEETEGQVDRLNKIAELMGIKLTGKKCKAMEGLIEEGKEVLEEKGKSALIDAALIGAAQRVEHYEIAAYGTAKAMADQLGLAKVVKLLEETMDEESAADEKLSAISLEEVLPATVASDAGDEENVEAAPVRRKAKKKA